MGKLWKILLATAIPSFRCSVVIGSVPILGHSSCRCNPNLTLSAFEINRLVSQYKLTPQEATIYGSGCTVHDQNVQECKAPTQVDLPLDCKDIYPIPSHCRHTEPHWCGKKWCYIANETECDLPFSQSDLLPDMFFSYATCGERDLFSSNPLEDAIRDVVLSAAYRVNSGGWLGSYHPDVAFEDQVPMVRDDQWFGMMPKLVEKFSESSGAIVNMTEAPLWVYEVSNSSSDFTDCVHAVSLGMLDFCTGMFTITTERAMMTTFQTVETTPLYLVTRLRRKVPFFERIFFPFRPFTGWAWVITLILLLASSYVLFWQEMLPGGGLDPKETPKGKRAHLRHLAGSFYSGVMAFLTGPPDFPITWEGRGTTVGIGFFILIVTSMYTANLTTLLVSDAATALLTGIDDAVAKRVNICIGENELQLVADLHPKANWELVDDRTAIIDNVSTGKCKGGLIYMEDLEELQSEGKYCRVVRVGFPVYNVFRGIPLNPLKAKELNYHFQKILNEGVWNHLKRKNLVNKCDSEDKNDSSSDSLQFDVIDLAGVFMLCAFATAFFGSCSIFRWRRTMIKKRQGSIVLIEEV